MEGRYRMPRHPEPYRGPRDDPRVLMHRGPGPLPPHPAALEEEIEYQHRDIQRLLSENRHVMDENIILQRDLAAVNDEMHRLGQVIHKLHAEKDAKTKDLIERGLKLESELRDIEPLRAEVVQLRAEAQKLNSVRRDMVTQVQHLTEDITRVTSENQQISAMRNDIDGMRKELTEARRAIEFEKKANEEQSEQKQLMEKNLITMAREGEKLRAEQLSLDRRGRGAGGYGILNGSPDTRYAGGDTRYASGAYGDVYGGGSWGVYDSRGSTRR
nr:PREDICTED: protein FLX-like 3 isoform X1 [Daucus carota subsp. sativus]XP_017227102.1 PREDICTED: protein FLX-like 3 isoform X2 [Daucus carota subsp. sativus]XP_017227103.1 PREDICTED: protein FLX-like 3 isoform X1 [Daucus carota subsp. sativus]